jgi:hypothetical protein
MSRRIVLFSLAHTMHPACAPPALTRVEPITRGLHGDFIVTRCNVKMVDVGSSGQYDRRCATRGSREAGRYGPRVKTARRCSGASTLRYVPAWSHTCRQLTLIRFVPI